MGQTRRLTRVRLARIAVVMAGNRDLIDGKMDAKSVATMMSDMLGTYVSPKTIRSAAVAADVVLTETPKPIGKVAQMANRIAELERRLVAINPELVNSSKKRLRPMPAKGEANAISG